MRSKSLASVVRGGPGDLVGFDSLTSVLGRVRFVANVEHAEFEPNRFAGQFVIEADLDRLVGYRGYPAGLAGLAADEFILLGVDVASILQILPWYRDDPIIFVGDERLLQLDADRSRLTDGHVRDGLIDAIDDPSLVDRKDKRFIITVVVIDPFGQRDVDVGRIEDRIGVPPFVIRPMKRTTAIRPGSTMVLRDVWSYSTFCHEQPRYRLTHHANGNSSPGELPRVTVPGASRFHDALCIHTHGGIAAFATATVGDRRERSLHGR